MSIELPRLPYSYDALSPVLSAEQMELHHDKHHRAYVDKVNKLIRSTAWEGKSLERLVVETPPGVLHNNAAQAWNHAFFWRCLTPGGKGKPEGRVAEAITRQYESWDAFQKQFTKAAVELFGSGWVWLSEDVNGRLAIEPRSNEGTPLEDGHMPLLCIDVWEHAYYVDYRNERAKFVKAFWDIVDWERVESLMTTKTRIAAVDKDAQRRGALPGNAASLH
jgi:Fe-Mn family superoxide dismutase